MLYTTGFLYVYNFQKEIPKPEVFISFKYALKHIWNLSEELSSSGFSALLPNVYMKYVLSEYHMFHHNTDVLATQMLRRPMIPRWLRKKKEVVGSFGYKYIVLTQKICVNVTLFQNLVNFIRFVKLILTIFSSGSENDRKESESGVESSSHFSTKY
jgi:hypothetical protein